MPKRPAEVLDLLARRNTLEVRLEELSGRERRLGHAPPDESDAAWKDCKAQLDRVQARLTELGEG